MRKGKISTEFAKHVSHAIHSLTIEDLQMYFDKGAGVNNSIPVGKNISKGLSCAELNVSTRTMSSEMDIRGDWGGLANLYRKVIHN